MQEKFMREAIEESRKSLKNGNVPVGCVIVLDNKIIARSHNESHTRNHHLAHTEMLALQSASQILKKKENRNKAVLYTTFEPCPMCFGATLLSWVKEIVYGINLDKSGATHFTKHLPEFYIKTRKEITITPNILAKECQEIFEKSHTYEKLKERRLI